MPQIADEKKPAQEAGCVLDGDYQFRCAPDLFDDWGPDLHGDWARSVVNGGHASGLGSLGGVLDHDIHDGGNLVQSGLDPRWREAVFSSKLGQKLGEDDLMLQWLCCALALKSNAPSFKSDLKRLVSKVATFFRKMPKPRRRYRRERPHDDTAQREQAVDYGRVEWGGHEEYSSRPDAMIVIDRTPLLARENARQADVVW